jgi:hypothetical protein
MRTRSAFESILRQLPFLLLGCMCIATARTNLQEDTTKAANPYGRKYPPRIYNTVKLKGVPPVINGRLDDPCWKEGEWHGDFKQQIPTEGAEPAAKTELKILFDEKNIYMAMRAYDDPKLIHRYSGRRDALIGDVLGVCLDSYADKRTGFEFDVTAAGSKIDLVLMNGENDCVWDTNWDAVWDGKAAMEDSAWTVEFRIPLSQLRYGPQEEQVWGLHAWRWIDRNQEEDQWNLVPRVNTGRMYNIGELHGIHGLKKFRHIEILPHVLGRVTTDPEQPGNPYATGSATMASAGLDAKIGLTSDFTLDATVNPDFGQVEADPSVMNLTAYETFYEEKRPFFLEGKNILDYSLGGNMLFYTRRIGHEPTYFPQLREGEFIKTPENTAILNAMKVTGKSKDGLSLGVVQSVTARETAQISLQGKERDQTVEPLSNYFVGRMQKDWNKGNTMLGGIATSAHRWIKDGALDFMPGDAVTAGLDFSHFFLNRSYRLDAKAVFSRISGKPEALLALQTNPVHYYQRPGADHLGVDSAAASLSGHGGLVSIDRIGNSKLRFSQGFGWHSPGLDMNDLGFLQQADVIQSESSVGYMQTETGRLFRDYHLSLSQSLSWDFGGLRTDATTMLDMGGDFLNLWGLSGMVLLREDAVDTRLLRGGPAVKLSRFLHTSVDGHTDFSKKFAVHAGIHKHFYEDGGSDLFEFTPGVSLRFTNAFSVSGNLAYSRNVNDLQYVATAQTQAGTRYVLGRIDQKTVGIIFRFSYHLTPDFSIQYYGSPFVSVGRYSDFKRVASSLANTYDRRFQRFGAGEIAYHPDWNGYTIHEWDGADYAFGNPDFSFRQFRSNLVVRWEYRPGSVLYVVWAQQRTGYESAWVESLNSNYCSLWSADQHNVFLAKLSYWFSI